MFLQGITDLNYMFTIVLDLFLESTSFHNCINLEMELLYSLFKFRKHNTQCGEVASAIEPNATRQEGVLSLPFPLAEE